MWFCWVCRLWKRLVDKFSRCIKRLVDKLIEECNENIEETSLIKINLAKCKSNSCILYIVLFSILFPINIRIATYFLYYIYTWIVIKKMFLNMIMFIKEKIINTCLKTLVAWQRIKWEQ